MFVFHVRGADPLTYHHQLSRGRGSTWSLMWCSAQKRSVRIGTKKIKRREKLRKEEEEEREEGAKKKATHSSRSGFSICTFDPIYSTFLQCKKLKRTRERERERHKNKRKGPTTVVCASIFILGTSKK